MRLLAVLLIFFSTLAHAGNGDFLKATIDGKPHYVGADSLLVVHNAGGDDFFADQTISLSGSYELPQQLMVLLYLPTGTPVKEGRYRIPSFQVPGEDKPPYAYLQLMVNSGPEDVLIWTADDSEDGEVVITSVKGKVVEGTFHGRLHTSNQQAFQSVTNGSFRFTLDETE